MYNIRREWVIREVELPPSLLASKRGLLKWFAISVGLLGENDTREGILVVLDALLEMVVGEGKEPTFDDIYRRVSRKYHEQGRRPPSTEAVRHHLRKMMAIGLVRRQDKRYILSTLPDRPDDITTSVDVIIGSIVSSRDLLKKGFAHLAQLYSM